MMNMNTRPQVKEYGVVTGYLTGYIDEVIYFFIDWRLFEPQATPNKVTV